MDTSNMQDYRQQLQQVTAIQTETIRRLIANNATPPLEMAAVLEDMANLYLDISDEIREIALGRQEAAPGFPVESLAAARQAAVRD